MPPETTTSSVTAPTNQTPINTSANLGSGLNQLGPSPFTNAVMFSAGINVNPPESMDFHDASSWGTWKTRFERYMCVAKIASRSEEEKINLLCYLMGKEAEPILLRILPNENQRTTYKAVKEAFDGYFAPRKNVIFERHRFNIRVQQPGEEVDVFITDLYTLAEKFEYGTLKDELIRDRIVTGVLDKKLSERMQLMAD